MRWLRLGIVTVLLIAVLGGWFVVYMLPSDDLPQDPDAVIVLGGAGPERTALGIALSDRYDAQLVLSSNARYFGRRHGVTCDEQALCFEPAPPNTAGEAENVARLAEQYGWDHVTVATSDFHTSRSRFLFRQCLGRDRVSVVGTGDEQGSMDLRLFLREATGLLAGATIARAC